MGHYCTALARNGGSLLKESRLSSSKLIPSNTSTLEPFRFTFQIFWNKNKTKNLNMPKGAGLTKPMKLSADLADVVGKKEASRAECIKQLWAYIKKNNLQDPENKQFFVPDKKMAKVFGSDRIRAFGMAKFLSAHLS